MLGGYIDFFMDPSLAESFVNLKQELDQLLQKKVSWPVTECLVGSSFIFVCIIYKRT